MPGFLCSMVGASFLSAQVEVLRSKKGITAVGNAQVSTAQNKFGGASALLDGNGDYLAIAQNPFQVSSSDDFTIEVFVRPVATQTSGFNWIMSAWNGSIGFLFGALGTFGSSTRTNFSIGGITIFDQAHPTAMTTGAWFHLAVTRNSGICQCWLNGTQIGYNISNTSAITYAGLATIGANSNTSNPVQFLNGYIDEVRISNSGRYTAGFTPSTTPFVNDANTVLLIHADGTNGSTFFEDDNGVRAPIGLTANNQAQISTAQAQFGGSSIVFDGADDFFNVIGLPSFASSDYTFECWARFDILPHNQTYAGGSYMMLNFGGGGDYIGISRTGAGNQVNIQIANVGQYGSFTKSGVNYAINTWYHIAAVRTGGVHKVFFNGTELTTFVNDSGFTNSGRTQNIFIGHIGKFGDGRGSIDGYLDEIRVSNSARYTGGDFTPSTTPFVNDANTRLLIHADGTNGSTVFVDDNGTGRSQRGITAIGNAQVSTAQSKFGGSSALFDGTGDSLTMTNPIPSSGNFTVEGWIRLNTSPSGNRSIWWTKDISGTNRGGLYMNSSGNLTWWNASDNLNYTGVLYTGVYYHIACVQDGGTRRLFVDGTMSASTSSHPRGEIMEIGRATYTSSSVGDWNGWQDEFRVSNTARYTGNFTPSTTPFQNDANTLLLLHCDGTNASTVFTDDNGVAPFFA